MPSVKNPNTVSRNRQVARAAKARKASMKRSTAGNKSRVEKSDTRRGARAGILPTSGPRAALSSKKQKKLERQLKYAQKRKEEAAAETEMQGMSFPSSHDQLAVDHS